LPVLFFAFFDIVSSMSFFIFI